MTGFADRLDVFLRVVAGGSFSAAGRDMNMQASSISRQIDMLEGELGVELFYRSTRRLALTSAGETLCHRARQVLGQLEETRSIVAAMANEPQGWLMISAPVCFGQRHVVPLVPVYLERFPKVHLELSLEDRAVNPLEDGIDLAVRIGKLHDSALLATKLATTESVVCAAPSYLQRHGVPAVPADLVHHACLTTPKPMKAGMWQFGETSSEDRLEVSGRFVCGDMDGLLASAIAGLGIIHLQTWLVAEPLRDGRLVRLFPTMMPRPDGSGIYALRPPGALTTKVKGMVDLLKARMIALSE
ncbi:LysR family transcriptional regulator [Rhizobium sp. LjRoot258]|uniref:LysR family transcriptional regulator n=1 Tax=Rhizobium sp. LjRoot258 TaxID=3342299 RepID=UPI003ED1316A